MFDVHLLASLLLTMPDTTQPPEPIRSVRISDEYRLKLLAAGFPPEWLSSGTAEDILRRLPTQFVHGESHCLFAAITFRGHPHGLGWIVGYRNFSDNTRHPEIDGQVGDTLVHAAVEMYCYLAENKLLS